MSVKHQTTWQTGQSTVFKCDICGAEETMFGGILFSEPPMLWTEIRRYKQNDQRTFGMRDYESSHLCPRHKVVLKNSGLRVINSVEKEK